jgi:hypothetical protein
MEISSFSIEILQKLIKKGKLMENPWKIWKNSMENNENPQSQKSSKSSTKTTFSKLKFQRRRKSSNQ